MEGFDKAITRDGCAGTGSYGVDMRTRCACNTNQQKIPSSLTMHNRYNEEKIDVMK